MSARARILVAMLGLLFASSLLSAQEKPLAATPPMGWNSWNKFGCHVSEDLIRQMADAMVKSGMKDAGYQYIVIDDCWQVERDRERQHRARCQDAFPRGSRRWRIMSILAGSSSESIPMPAVKTCAKRPGSLGHEYQDALQYAAWGVDYLKYDWCNTSTQDAQAAYALIRNALNADGPADRAEHLRVGHGQAVALGREGRRKSVAHHRRHSRPVGEQGQRTHLGMLDILDLQDGIESYAGPGHWNDPDMLEVGNGGMTTDEYRAHFSLWSILAAPLIAGNDLRDMKPEIHDILTNKEVIAVNQDPLGSEGRRVRKDGDLEVWAKQMQDGSRTVVLLNRDTTRKRDWFLLGRHRLSQPPERRRSRSVEGERPGTSSTGNSLPQSGLIRW